MINDRRIPKKKPPTHVDRTQTNDSVMNKINYYGVQTQKLSECWKSQKMKLLGHILRADRYDPLRQVFFEFGTTSPRINYYRRIGRPRADWLQETTKDALRACGKPPVNIPSDLDLTLLQSTAKNRQAPF